MTARWYSYFFIPSFSVKPVLCSALQRWAMGKGAGGAKPGEASGKKA